MDLKGYAGLAYRQRLVIILAFATVVLAVGVYVFAVTPLYEADCKLLLVEDKSVGSLGTLVADLTLQSLGNSDPIATQMEIIKTRPILSRVIELAQMKGPDGGTLKTETLREQLIVAAVRNTNLISVSYRNRDPRRAALVVNTLSSVFEERNQKMNQEELTSTRKFLEEQLGVQRRTLSDAEKAVLDFKSSHKSFSLEEEAQAMVNAEAQLSARGMELETQLKGAQAQRAELASKMANPGAVDDPSYERWRMGMEEAAGQITGIQAQQDNTLRQLARVRSSLTQLPPREVEMARLLRNEKVASEIYSTLLQEFEEVRMNEAAKIATIRLVEPAVVPDRPVFPDKKLYLLGASLLGLLAGLALALAFEHFDDSPRSLEELRTLLPYDILGYIPRERSPSALFLSRDPQSPVSESIRLVQANLRFKPAAREKCFSIMVTSATPGEGKSTLAANLSFAFGSNGTRAAVVNLDLRKPTFNAIFGRRMDRGLTDYLIGESALEDIMVKEERANLTVIPSGRIPPNPSELVASHRLPDLMQRLSRTFDVVIYDTPPVTLVAETLELARYVNGIILVVDLSVVTRSSLKAMNELVSNKGLVILGTIVNKVNAPGSRYHGYGSYEYRAGKAR